MFIKNSKGTSWIPSKQFLRRNPRLQNSGFVKSTIPLPNLAFDVGGFFFFPDNLKEIDKSYLEFGF